jgi:Flp pilus assembly protein TadG
VLRYVAQVAVLLQAEMEAQANFSRRERGQSLTELAVSFTLLVIILAVTVDLGRVFFSFIALREAAEEGALYGSLNPQDNGGIIMRARQSSSAPVDLTNTSNVAVQIIVIGSSCAGNTLRVTVTYTYTLTMPMISAFIGTQTFPLVAQATSTILRPEC